MGRALNEGQSRTLCPFCTFLHWSSQPGHQTASQRALTCIASVSALPVPSRGSSSRCICTWGCMGISFEAPKGRGQAAACVVAPEPDDPHYPCFVDEEMEESISAGAAGPACLTPLAHVSPDGEQNQDSHHKGPRSRARAHVLLLLPLHPRLRRDWVHFV